MQDVMRKAQELADAVVASSVYTRMKELEDVVSEDEAAAEAMENMIASRKRVEEILTMKNMDPEELKRAGEVMQQAEKRMNENERIQELKQARKDFSTMMDNVNRILRLVITGEIREEDLGEASCGGSCEGCTGCG